MTTAANGGLSVAEQQPWTGSQALRGSAKATEPERHEDLCFAPWDAGPGFRISVASDLPKRLHAYRLAYRVYRERGLAPEHRDRCAVYPYDACPETFTLLAEDTRGTALGTVSLVFDGPGRLPCDDVFGAEMHRLRGRARRLVEVTRLALDRRSRGNRQLLVRLINLICLYARRAQDATDFVIEVNPNHAGFYGRSLLFEPVGEEQACHRVNGAPARLLRLDLRMQARVLLGISEVKCAGRPIRPRHLYARFMPYEMEASVSRDLACAHRPMSSDEIRHFQLPETE